MVPLFFEFLLVGVHTPAMSSAGSTVSIASEVKCF